MSTSVSVSRQHHAFVVRRSPAAFAVPGAACGEGTITLNLLAATAQLGTHLVPLGGRDLELAAAIGLRERPISRADLLAEIWPDADELSATNAFNVCLHRLRRRLGRRDAILLSAHGYLLGPAVTTDLGSMAAFARTLQPGQALTDREIDALMLARSELGRAALPPNIAATETGALFERTVEYLKHRFGQRLAQIALDADRLTQALDIALDLIGADACDESAWEIVVRAHLARRDRASALHEYRTYARNLQRELGLLPSRAIAALFADDGGAPRYGSATPSSMSSATSSAAAL